MMKDCPDCGGIGSFNESKCCLAEIGGDGCCNECHNPTEPDPCVYCGGTGLVPDDNCDDADDFGPFTEADSEYSQRILDKFNL